MAEQTEPVKRKVALKVIKPGMDSKQIIARFEAERQALAMMDHVNIARVFDGGSTGGSRQKAEGSQEADGSSLPSASCLLPSDARPYFVMELVHGVPITKYCDDNQLTPRERLELFVPVCQAIQHAHQKGIIHRDIKPSNVMVTLYDGKPVPKVIDFGVAKATEQKLTERTLFTQYGTMIGTLEYMSPEQAEMSALGVDTRSDIYSLGVLLYELLTGSTPLSHKRLKEAAYAEILRIIKEEEPPKPSTRLSDSGEALASISAQRHMEPAKLTKLVRGELDWIVMKSLEKDRNRRYETANGFAMDVQRYLADEPVQACPPSAIYRFRKFARRNKTILTTAALIALALVLGTVISAWQAVRATLAEERAETEATSATAEAVKAQHQRQRAEGNMHLALQVLHDMYRDMTGKWFVDDADPEPWQREFLQQMLTFHQRFLRENADNPAVLFQMAKAHGATGEIYRELGELDQSKAAFQQAIHLLNQLLTDFPDDPNYRQALAGEYNSLGILLAVTGQPKQAEDLFRKSIALKEALAAQFPSQTIYRLELTAGHINLGSLLRGKSRFDEAEQSLRRAVDLTEGLTAQGSPGPEYQRRQASSWYHLALVLYNRRRPEEAEKAYLRAAGIGRKLVIDYPHRPAYLFDLALCLNNLALMQESAGKGTQAEKTWPEQQALLKQLRARSPTRPKYRQKLAQSYYNHGNLLEDLKQRERAEAAHRQALELWTELAAEFPRNAEYQSDLGATLNNLALLLRDRGELDQACRLLEKAVPHQRTALEADSRNPLYREHLGNHCWNLARILLRLKDHASAARWAREAARLDPEQPGDQNDLAWFFANFPEPQFRDPKLAVELASKAVKQVAREGGYWNTLGAAQYRAGDPKAAIAALQKSVDLTSGGSAFDFFFLAMARHKLGDKAEARKSYDKGVAWMEKKNSKDEELRRFRAEAAELLGIEKPAPPKEN